jgi:DNA-binding NarL/FixJ family response regulator
MRILVVDDKFDSRWGIADWLVAFLEAVAVESAASAAEALQLLERRQPDVVLATHAMADGGGPRARAAHQVAAGAAGASSSSPSAAIARFEAACGAAGVDFLARETASCKPAC